MSFFRFYIILTALGVLLDILGFIFYNSGGTTGILVFCLIGSIVFLFVGIRGISGKLKSYM